MHRAGDASVRLPDRPSPKRLPLGEPSTSGAPHSVQAGHYESGVSGSSGPGAKSAQFPRSPCVESRRCPSPDRQGGTEDARGREADAFRGVRAAGIGSARFPPCAKDARGREADAFRGVRCGRDPREQIPSLRRGTHAAAKRTPSGVFGAAGIRASRSRACAEERTRPRSGRLPVLGKEMHRAGGAFVRLSD